MTTQLLARCLLKAVCSQWMLPMINLGYQNFPNEQAVKEHKGGVNYVPKEWGVISSFITIVSSL